MFALRFLPDAARFSEDQNGRMRYSAAYRDLSAAAACHLWKNTILFVDRGRFEEEVKIAETRRMGRDGRGMNAWLPDCLRPSVWHSVRVC